MQRLLVLGLSATAATFSAISAATFSAISATTLTVPATPLPAAAFTTVAFPAAAR